MGQKCIEISQPNSNSFLFFSISDIRSFNNINGWFRIIKNNVDKIKKIIFLISNKIDCLQRKESNEEAKKYAINNKMKYFETSTKNKGCG